MTAIVKEQSAATAQESLNFATKWGDALYSMFEQSEWTFGKIGQAFKKMIQGMLARAAVIGAINFLTGDVGGFSGAFIGALRGRRAAGGPVYAGSPYLVGERGPEIIVPRQSGKVIPNGAGAVDNSRWELNFYDTAEERAKMVGLDDEAFSRQFKRCIRDEKIKMRKLA